MPTKKKIHKLRLDFEIDFQLIGIASHENDYRLSWALNKALGLELVKADNFKIHHPKHKLDIQYSMYVYDDDLEYINYSLIANKSENGFLLPDQKNIDFILKVSGSLEMSFLNNLLKNLKGVDIVITAFLLDDVSDKMWKVFSF